MRVIKHNFEKPQIPFKINITILPPTLVTQYQLNKEQPLQVTLH